MTVDEAMTRIRQFAEEHSLEPWQAVRFTLPHIQQDVTDSDRQELIERVRAYLVE